MNNKLPSLNFFLWLFFYLAIFSYTLHISFSGLDPDFPWHLQIGKQIVTERAVPNIEYYNHTLENTTWVDHEWLFNVFFYSAFKQYGYLFLNIFFASLVTLIFILLKNLTQKLFIRPYLQDFSPSKKSDVPKPVSNDIALILIMSLSAYSLYASKLLLGVRMQIAGNLLFLFLLFLLESFNKTKRKSFLLLLPLVFIFWANLHGSFLIGLFALWSFTGFKLIETFISNTKLFKFFEFNPLNKKEKYFLFSVSLLSTIATLINAYGLKLYLFLSTYSNNAYMSTISEWRSFFYYPIFYNGLAYSAIFCSILFLIAHSLSSKSNLNYGWKLWVNKINPWFLFLSIFFLVLSLKSKRHFPLFLITSFSLIVQFLYFEFVYELKINFSKIYQNYLKLFFIGLFILISYYFISKANINNDPFQKATDYRLPAKLTEFLKKLPDIESKKVLNSYAWGGYFLWAIPEMKLFIDGRMPQAKYQNHSILEEYMEIFEEGKSEELLNKHAIDLIVMQNDINYYFSSLDKLMLSLDENKINSEPNKFFEFLDKSKDWEKIFSDEYGVVYQKKN